LAILVLSVDRQRGRVQDHAAKSCFVNDMVKKHLPGNHTALALGEQSARAVQLPFIGNAVGRSLAAPLSGRYKPPRPASHQPRTW
jgi:hypothetical protein